MHRNNLHTCGLAISGRLSILPFQKHNRKRQSVSISSPWHASVLHCKCANVMHNSYGTQYKAN